MNGLRVRVGLDGGFLLGVLPGTGATVGAQLLVVETTLEKASAVRAFGTIAAVVAALAIWAGTKYSLAIGAVVTRYDFHALVCSFAAAKSFVRTATF